MRREGRRERLIKKGPACPVTFPDCVQCGRVFASHGSVTICSDACRQARKIEADRAFNQTRRPTVARSCGCGTQLSGRRQKCDPCIELAKRQRKQRDKRRRRALKFGVASEPYTLAEIALRDGHHCKLCGREVDMLHTVPHPKAPTIDHAIALAAGGDDTRANVQLAHFLCNSLKGAGDAPRQLALAG